MFKKLIFIIPVAIFTLISAPISAHACDFVCPEGQETCENPCEDGLDGSTITGTIAEPTGDTAEILETAESEDESAAVPAGEFPATNVGTVSESPDAAEILETDTEPNPVIAKIEQIAEEQLGLTLDAETWPLVLSATALILTVLLIIIINLIARSKARKATAKANREDLAAGLDALNPAQSPANEFNGFRDL